MPEHIRALFVILALASVVFVFAKGPACAVAMAPADFERRRNLWFAVTLAAFLAHNFWVFIIAAGSLLFVAAFREQNRMAMFFLLLFAVPAFSAEIPGAGGIRYFFEMNYVRLLVLAVLLPAFLSLQRQSDLEPFGRTLPDKLVAGYLVLILMLMFTVSTLPGALRAGVFYAFIDVLLPYYVASRSLKNVQHFRDALMALAIAALVLSAIGIFEFARHWLLYSSLEDALGVRWGYGNYLEREDTLRAQGTTGQPIPFGYVMAVGACLILYLKNSIPNKAVWMLGLLLLVAGLIAGLSRGPWVGAAAMVLAFIALGPSGGPRIAMIALAGIVVLPVLMAFPIGAKIIDYLPFVGTIDEGSVTYRQRLIEIAIQIIWENPLLGAFNYIHSPAMQELRQGQGIIDIVNTYIAVALGSGLVGLSFFVGFFVAIAAGIFTGMRRLTNRNADEYVLGQVLLSTLLGILVIIFTVSSISVIPVIYWSIAGFGVAYVRMIGRLTTPALAPAQYLSRSPIGLNT